MKYLNTYESHFVDKSEIDNLLDKISDSGIVSEKNRLDLFSNDDKEIIETIEKMADITNQFHELNNEIRRRQRDNISSGKELMDDWLELNDQLRPLEASFRKWGIELGDHRLYNLMNKTRPDAYYNRGIIED